MKIEFKLNCKDLTGDLREGSYELAEGITVDGALAAAFAEVGRPLTENVYKSLVFMVNGRSASGKTVLNEGDTLRVLFRILGG
jgi:sulfur carrier protein ThiS